MTEPLDAATPDAPAPDAPPRSTRARARWLVALGGTLATAVGIMAMIVLVSTALDGSGRSGSSLWLVVMVIGVVTGGFVAALGFRHLGVRPGVRTALLGSLVGVVGVLLPWVAAVVAGRLSS